MAIKKRRLAEVLWMGCLLSLMTASSVWGANLKKGAYLFFDGNNTQMVVNWQTDAAPTTSTIEWGTTTSYGNGPYSVAQYGDYQFKYTFTGLTPGQKYFYHVNLDGAHQYGQFYAAPPATQPNLTFYVYGDTRTYPASQNNVLGWLLADMNTDPANRETIALHSGDMVNTDNETTWQSDHFNRSYSNILDAHRLLPFQVCRGNHESGTAIMRKYYPYSYPNGSMNYYSYDYGPVHICVVDDQSTRSVGSTQYNWIQQDLQNSTRTWKIVLWHMPAYGCGTHGNDATNQTLVQNLLEAYGADVLFTGHNHQWCYCYKADGAHPIHHVTVGGGGADLYNVSSSYPYYVYGEMVYNYTRVDIAGCQMTITAFGNSNSANPPSQIYKITDTAPNGPCSICAMTVNVTPNGTTQVTTGNPITFTATASGGATPYSYQWTRDGSDISGATNFTLTETYGTIQTHTYNCKVASSGCVTAVQDATASVGDWQTGSVPGEVPSQSWIAKIAQSWDASAGATGYKLQRGQRANLPSLLTTASDSCNRYTGASTSIGTLSEDPAVLAGGDFYWYLVVPYNGIGDGPVGNATAGPRTVNSSGSCP